MKSIRNSTITFLVSLYIILGGFSLVAASETTGTLSSDGGAQTQQGDVLSETNSDDTTGQTVAQNSGQIEGSVTEGREESATALVDSASWVIPLAVAILAALAYMFWRRETT